MKYQAHHDEETQHWTIYCGNEIIQTLPSQHFSFPVINKMIAELNRFHAR